jgi:lysozyme
MNDLNTLRQKVHNALFKKCDGTSFCQQDYDFDDLVRKYLKLPPRPRDALPYVGWIIENSSDKSTKHEISEDGVNAIKQWEGCVLSAYRCSAGVPTIGYGHTKTAKMGMTITLEQAEMLLKQDLKEYVRAVNSLVSIPISQNQFDALVSFCFNVGISAFKHSTLLRLLNENNLNGTGLAFGNWVFAGGRKLAGLVNRRQFEREMFLKDV